MPLYRVTVISSDETALRPASTGFDPAADDADARMRSGLPASGQHEVMCDEDADGFPEACDPRVFCDVPVTAEDAGEEIKFILWDTAQNEFVVESSHLAQLVDEELAEDLTIRNRGVKQAAFVVLAGVYLPAVLVETAFISNPREEELLKDDAFQDTVVNGVVEAIIRFKLHYGR